MSLTKPNLLSWATIIGIFLFFGLYIYAASLYPGGSQLDANSIGHDWFNNYWCDLTTTPAINGMDNPGSSIAILAMLILCISCICFFINFAQTCSTTPLGKNIILVCGSVAMFLVMFIFTDYHNIMIILSSLFGLPVVIGIIIEIYQSDLFWYKCLGLVSLLLLALCNGLYYGGIGIVYLPFVQKITFVVVLGWIFGLSWELGKVISQKRK